MNHKSISIIFFGNSKYSLIGAKIIHEQLELSGIVTIENSPVANFATEQNIPLITTNKLTSEIIKEIHKLKPDFLVVEDYGLILPQELLDIPIYAPINIHHSLLPKYRGPTPAPSAILNGEKKSGVTIIKMTNEVDAGDILAQQEYELQTDETTDSLLIILNHIGANLLVEVIKNYAQITPISQIAQNATYTPRLSKQDGFIDISQIKNRNPLEIGNLKLKIERAIRAYYPWPGVWTKMNLGGKEKIVKLLPIAARHSGEREEVSESRILKGISSYQPNKPLRHPELDSGSSFSHLRSDRRSSAKDSSLYENEPFLLQVEGKRPMTIKDFLNGYPEAKEVINKLI